LQDFRKLAVWQKAHHLTLEVYRVTRGFPKDELYGMTSQIRRAAASVPTNIAEGCGRRSDADFARFLSIAMGSASELDYLIVLSRDLNLMNARSADALAGSATELKRMLASLIRKIEADN
jgi:four helix bundle protein